MTAPAKSTPDVKGHGRLKKLLPTAGMVAGFAAIVVLLMLYLAGAFHRKVAASSESFVPGRPLGDAKLAAVESMSVDAIEPAVGTIRPVYESAVASKIMERIVEMNVKAGQVVKKGQVLARLDDRTLKSRLDQAQSSLKSAEAAGDQADKKYAEIKAAFDKHVATETELSEATNLRKGAQAELSRAQQAVQEAQIALTYAAILSPMDGTVVDKKVEVGDTVSPGQVLLTLYDPGRMQLIATVRESLAHQLAVGNPIKVHIDAIDATCTGTVSEIVPEAQSGSRSFSVKVTGPCRPGVYAGMFGRLLIPLGQEKLLVIPQAAVRRVGQLDLVEVAVEQDGKTYLQRRSVQLGQTLGDKVRVLSGLSEGERVAVR